MSEFWNGRTAFVTGGTGLLGSWLVPALLDRGARVVVLVRDLVPESLLATSGTLERCVRVFGDVRDGKLLERILVEYEVDAVFHLAAQTIVGHAVVDPVGTFKTNIEGSWELLDACRRTQRPSRIVVASSDKAYGQQQVLPYTEDQPLQGRAPYDVSKSCADLISIAYAKTYELPVTITRCGNLFGGGDLNFNRLVPGTIRSALRGERPVLRSDGGPVRDYLYVEDAVEAYIALAERADEDVVRGRGWNFSTETPMTALQMAKEILIACGREDLELRIAGGAEHEIEHQYLSALQAKAVLGWKPTYTLQQGLTRTVDWYSAHLDA